MRSPCRPDADGCCVCGKRPRANCRKGCEALEAFQLSLVGASSHFQAVDPNGDEYRVGDE